MKLDWKFYPPIYNLCGQNAQSIIPFIPDFDSSFSFKCFIINILMSEFTHVMLKVYVNLAALSAEWPGRRTLTFCFHLLAMKNTYTSTKQ